jgi:hypothetical protein
MTKLQFILAGYLPYFSFKKWKWGWLSPYGCFITNSVWNEAPDISCYNISYTIDGKENNIGIISTNSIAKLKKQEELLIKFSTAKSNK